MKCMLHLIYDIRWLLFLVGVNLEVSQLCPHTSISHMSFQWLFAIDVEFHLQTQKHIAHHQVRNGHSVQVQSDL